MAVPDEFRYATVRDAIDAGVNPTDLQEDDDGYYIDMQGLIRRHARVDAAKKARRRKRNKRARKSRKRNR